MIRKDCFFCFLERDMGASWEACSFNADFNDSKFWALKDTDCDNCPNYISDHVAREVVRQFVANQEQGR